MQNILKNNFASKLNLSIFDFQNKKEMKKKLLEKIKYISLVDYFYFLGQNSSTTILKKYLADNS